MSNFNYNTIMTNVDQFIESSPMVNKYLSVVEQKTNIKKRYIVFALGSFISVYLVIGYAKDLVCNSIGFVYPAYISVKAIESPSKDDDTEWLMYWVVFATFSVVEFFSDMLLEWFPFYFLGKCLFLLWCMLPVSWNGSAYIYNRVIRPFVKEHESQIDMALNRVQEGAKKVVTSASNSAKEQIQEEALSAAKDHVEEEIGGNSEEKDKDA